MKICFTLDDVIRAKTEMVYSTYKNVDDNFDLESVDYTTNDYFSQLPFDSKSEYYKYLYSDYSFEIFGKSDETEKSIDKKLNLWLIDVLDKYEDEDIKFCIGNPFEFNNSIGYTYFYLSKIATRIREIHLPTDSLTLYDNCDVLVTADPKLLENKPEGKVTVKIETRYNKDIDADYSYTALSEFLNDTTIIDKLLNKETDEEQ